MRRLFYIVAMVAMFCVTGCREEDKIQPAPAGSLTVEHDRTTVRLNNTTESFEVRFTTPYDWHITTIGKGFEVMPTRGAGGSEPQCVTITPLSENSGSQTITRGSFDICLDKYATKHRIDVMQCPVIEQTVLAYLFGTSLSYYFNINVDCMKQAIGKDILRNERLLVFVQKTRNKGVIKELYRDPRSNEPAECVMCEVELPETLTGEMYGEYLCEMMRISPSERYSMIVGGHSTAWLPTVPSSGGVELSVSHAYQPNWTPIAGAEVTRTIGENNVKLNVDEFAKGLTATGRKFDWLYFDVCFMSSLEAAYALRNNTDYVIGSPCEIMGYGSPFDLLLDELFADDLAGACRTYCDYYTNDYYGSKSGCMATIVCSELDTLAAATKRLNELSVVEDFDITSVQSYEGRSAHIFFDAEHYALNAYDDDEAVAAFCAQLDKTVINRNHTEKFYSTYNAMMNDIVHYSGVSITPNEGCVAVLEQQIEKMKSDPQVDPNAYSALQEQLDELKHYLPSLVQTEWYKATH